LAGGLVVVIAVLLALTAFLDSPAVAVVLLVLLGFGSLALGPAIQMRIVEQAGGAPTMVSAGVQSAFNIANTIGAWLGGAVIAAGAGLRAPNLVGAALAVVGLVLLGASALLELRQRRTTTTAQQPEPVPAAA